MSASEKPIDLYPEKTPINIPTGIVGGIQQGNQPRYLWDYPDEEDRTEIRENRVGGFVLPWQELWKNFQERHPELVRNEHVILPEYLVMAEHGVREDLKKQEQWQQYPFTVITYGENCVSVYAAGVMLVTQCMDFPEGYVGYPQEDIPPFERGEREKVALEMLKELGFDRTDEYWFRTILYDGECPEVEVLDQDPDSKARRAERLAREGIYYYY